MNPVCSICNYDLTGIKPNDDHRLTCPECGTLLKPAPPDSIFTKKAMHRRFRNSLLLPTTLPTLIVLPLSTIPGIISEILVGLLSLYLFFGIPVFFFSTLDIAFQRSKPHPRPVPRWTIPLLTILYTLPGIATAIIFIWVYDTYIV
jgi:hypothetical protein